MYKSIFLNVFLKDRNLIKNIECYKLKKADNQTKKQYIEQVSNCFDKITNEINASTIEVINSILETRNAEVKTNLKK